MKLGLFNWTAERPEGFDDTTVVAGNKIGDDLTEFDLGIEEMNSLITRLQQAVNDGENVTLYVSGMED